MLEKHLFPGGIHPAEGLNGKKTNSLNQIRVLEAPPRVIIPLQQHIGAPAKAIVNAGDHVLMGQKIGEATGVVSASVHSSVSGKVIGIQPAMLANGIMVPAVIIDNDYQDDWIELHPVDRTDTLTAEEFTIIMRDNGIVGLGGATFPASVKMTSAPGKKIEKILVNGSECEPYLTADHRLMLERYNEIIDGIELMMHSLNVRKAAIGIESNKPDAIQIMTSAASSNKDIEVVTLPTLYPQGGEKQLVFSLTGHRVPAGGLPLDVGVIVCNVGTVYAIQRAIREGRPLINRVTTVGGLVKRPGNFWVRIGTTVECLIDACNGLMDGVTQFIYGGPMMGLSISRWDIPVTKGCSGLVALGREAIEPKESPCIRCGRCMRACPMRLFPSRIDAYFRNDRFEDAEKIGVMSCIECGACTYSCPAKRNLTQSCRATKAIIQKRRKEKQLQKKGA